ncbi:MAG TPA: hypothetical protein VN661_02620 [Candidatus Acidoferrales bacterium]|nr:hypothetical protein [Candidatus Acidoferrales bacterium]
MHRSARRLRFFPFLPGDLAEVRSAEEILSTLDGEGRLEGAPFMPEMLAYCGRRFEVLRRADKTCAPDQSIRRLRNTVLLKELRCDGSAHGGCEAGCLFFWKEQWLKRPQASGRATPNLTDADKKDDCPRNFPSAGYARALRAVEQATRTASITREGAVRERFSCQTTEVARFTTFLPWWDPRQYVRDVASKNVTFGDLWRGILIGARNKLACARGRPDVRMVAGDNIRTPRQNLDLQPGDLVQVKSREDIGQTLNSSGKNRGLRFSPGMVGYCEKEFRVLRRVNKIIDEKTGEMISLKTGCVILEGAVCPPSARRFCPRMVYQYWRDVWLKKLEQPTAEIPAAAAVAAAARAQAPSITTLAPEPIPLTLAAQVKPPAVSPGAPRIREAP